MSEQTALSGEEEWRGVEKRWSRVFSIMGEMLNNLVSMCKDFLVNVILVNYVFSSHFTPSSLFDVYFSSYLFSCNYFLRAGRIYIYSSHVYPIYFIEADENAGREVIRGALVAVVFI